MVVRFDKFKNFMSPTLTLCNPNNTKLYVIDNYSDLKIEPTFNAFSEVSLKIYRYYNDNGSSKEFEFYRYVQKKRQILISDIGYFIISKCEEFCDNDNDYKDINLVSCEYEFTQKKLNYLKGTYKFYDYENPADTLLYQLISTMPRWTIGTIDSLVMNLQRTFDVPDNTVYGFMMNDVEKAYDCIFEFNIMDRTVDVYSKHNYVNQTDILLTKEDNLDSVKITENNEDIITALTVTGEDELSINTINPLKTNTIYNFSYYKNTDWMSQGLVDSLTNWENYIEMLSNSYGKVVLNSSWSGTDDELISLCSDGNLNSPITTISNNGEYHIYCAYNMPSSENTDLYARILTGIKSNSAGDPVFLVGLEEFTSDDYQKWILENVSGNEYKIKNKLTGLYLTDGDSIALYENNSTNYQIWIFNSTSVESKWKVQNKASFKYLKLYNSQSDGYKDLFEKIGTENAKLQNLDSQINSTKDQISKYETQKSIAISDNAILSSINTSISNLNEQLQELESEKDKIISSDTGTLSILNSKQTEISQLLKFENYFTQEEYEELFSYISESTYQDEYIIITDNMTYSDISSKQLELYNKGLEILEKNCQPELEFDIETSSFIFDYNFLPYTSQIKTGCLINYVGDYEIISLILLKMSIDIDNKKITLQFGNRYRLNDPLSMFSDIYNETTSSANTVNFEKSVWGKPVKSGKLSEMDKFMNSSISLTTNQIKSSDGQSVEVTDSGVSVRKVTEDESGAKILDPKELKITNSTVAISNDNFETSKAAFGTYLLPDGTEVFGVLADVIVGNIVVGTNLYIGIPIVNDDGVSENVQITDVITNIEGEIKLASKHLQYMSFDDVNGLIIGEKDGNFKSQHTSTAINFLEGNDIISYISNKRFSTHNLAVGLSGKGFFDFIPRNNGNLSITWRSE